MTAQTATLASFRIKLHPSETREQWACRAETADCNCPDPCERDHGND
jgi:hypothetical protein